jgi:FkbM family methyltransferase
MKNAIKRYLKRKIFSLSESEKLVLEVLKNYLRQGPIVVVDIGHHKGHFIEHLTSTFLIPRKSLYVHGVDPINYNSSWADVFDEVAIASEIGNRQFNIYDEPGCNSLFNMRTDALTLEKNSSGWFSNYMINKIDEIQVKTVTLDSILSKYPLVHYLKIDAQGSDLDVLRSGHDCLKSVIFVQIESSVANNPNELMYEGQSYLSDNLNFMKSMGFSLVQVIDHSSEAPPEADVIFINNLYGP